MIVFRSLRGRYLFVSVLLTVLVLTSVWLAQGYVARASRQNSASVELHNDAVRDSDMLKDDVWNVWSALQSFDLMPSPAGWRVFERRLDKARADAAGLAARPWVNAIHQGETAQALQADLERLSGKSNELVKMRLDARSLLPAMKTVFTLMLPANKGFNTALTLMRHKIRVRGDRVAQAGIQGRLDQIDREWNHMTAAFQQDMIRWTGLLDHRRSDRVPQYYERVQRTLETLRDAERRGAMTAQPGRSLDDMARYARAWYQGYEQARKINTSGRWRADVPIMKNALQPLFSEIWNRLRVMDAGIESGLSRNMARQAEVTTTIVRVLWILSGTALAFIIMGYVYFERTVLRPVARVALALKQEARGKDGVRPPSADAGEIQDLIDAFSELQKQVYARQAALEHQALHDTLTGLPNRSLLMDRLQQAILALRRENKPCALMIMDLDRFKDINDTLGHQTGDLLLQQVSVRLNDALRESDTAARLGGDEFALLLPGADQHFAEHIAQRVLKAMEQMFTVNDHSLRVGASLGIALYPRHGQDAQTLIQHADVAMYVAKRSHGGYAFYDSGQDPHSVERLGLVTDLGRAISNDALELYYQPKVAIATRRVTGAEALLRWRHGSRGFIPPDEVIPLAEQTGLIRPLTQWVINAALRQCALWLSHGRALPVAINLSARNLQDPNLDGQIGDYLAAWSLPQEFVELEITEGAVMDDPQRAQDMLTRLDQMGVRIAIDDYGTGFSSLAYLKKLPVNELKIDKSFVMDMDQDDNDAVIVRSTIDLAHNLGLRVTAEGVESLEIWNLLEMLGCDTAQGYYISPPLPAAEFERWMDRYRPREQNETSSANPRDAR